MVHMHEPDTQDGRRVYRFSDISRAQLDQVAKTVRAFKDVQSADDTYNPKSRQGTLRVALHKPVAAWSDFDNRVLLLLH